MGVLLVILFLFPNGKTIERRYIMRSMTECMLVLSKTLIVRPRNTGEWGYYKTCAYRHKRNKRKKKLIKKTKEK